MCGGGLTWGWVGGQVKETKEVCRWCESDRRGSVVWGYWGGRAREGGGGRRYWKRS